MPVARSIWRWVDPAFSRVQMVVCKCSFKTFTPVIPLKGEGVKVTSCLVTSEELARRGQHINLRWPGSSSLGGHKWSTLSGHRGPPARSKWSAKHAVNLYSNELFIRPRK